MCNINKPCRNSSVYQLAKVARETGHIWSTCRLKFPSVMVIYQNAAVSTYGMVILIGLMDRSLFCTSSDLIKALTEPVSPLCAISGTIVIMEMYQQDTVRNFSHASTFLQSRFTSVCMGAYEPDREVRGHSWRHGH